jgi:hypothetical protein
LTICVAVFSFNKCASSEVGIEMVAEIVERGGAGVVCGGVVRGMGATKPQPVRNNAAQTIEMFG